MPNTDTKPPNAWETYGKMNFQSLYLIINLLINKPRRNLSNHTQHRKAGSSDVYRKGKAAHGHHSNRRHPGKMWSPQVYTVSHLKFSVFNKQ